MQVARRRRREVPRRSGRAPARKPSREMVTWQVVKVMAIQTAAVMGYSSVGSSARPDSRASRQKSRTSSASSSSRPAHLPGGLPASAVRERLGHDRSPALLAEHLERVVAGAVLRGERAGGDRVVQPRDAEHEPLDEHRAGGAASRCSDESRRGSDPSTPTGCRGSTARSSAASAWIATSASAGPCSGRRGGPAVPLDRARPRDRCHATHPPGSRGRRARGGGAGQVGPGDVGPAEERPGERPAVVLVEVAQHGLGGRVGPGRRHRHEVDVAAAVVPLTEAERAVQVEPLDQSGHPLLGEGQVVSGHLADRLGEGHRSTVPQLPRLSDRG